MACEGRIVQLVVDTGYIPVLLSLIECAVRQIVFVNCSWHNLSRKAFVGWKILDALNDAHVGSGVEVWGVLNGYDINRMVVPWNRKVRDWLGVRGMKVYISDAKRTQHGKVWVFDREFVLMSSHNLNPGSLQVNSEIGVVLQSKELALQILVWAVGLRESQSGLWEGHKARVG